MRRDQPVSAWVRYLGVCLLVGGCSFDDQPKEGSEPLPSRASVQDESKLVAAKASPDVKGTPPTVAFEQPETWRPRYGDAEPVPPPDLSGETWRAFASRYEPLQQKNPQWQHLPVEENVELAMPAGSRHECLVQPLKIEPLTDETGAELHAWLLQRLLLCSADGWQTWQVYPQDDRILVDGTRQRRQRNRAYLRERQRDGSVHQLGVMLRSDRERREARTGPPQILLGAVVDED